MSRMVKGRRDPTMKSSQFGCKERGVITLENQYKSLEDYWDTVKQLLDSKSTLRLLNKYSPRDLMSALQLRMSPSEEGHVSKVRHNEMVAEILTERLAAIKSGKLKARRLFEAFEGESDTGLLKREEVSDSRLDLVRGSQEVRSILCSCGSDDEDDDVNPGIKQELVHRPICGSSECSSAVLSNKKFDDDQKENVVLEKEGVERQGSGVQGGGGNGGMRMLAMAWFAVVLMLFTLGIIAMRCNGGGIDDEEYQINLVPT